MAEYWIEYKAHNNYSETVLEAVFEFLITPCVNEYQTLIFNSCSNSLAETLFSYQNMYGYNISKIGTVKRFNDFYFSMQSKVEVKSRLFLPSNLLSTEQEQMIINSTEFYIDHHLFLQPTPLTKLNQDSLQDVPMIHKHESVFEFSNRLSDFLYNELSFELNVTSVTSNAQDVWDLKRGVCQDFTHLFIAICRLNNIPTRYVSGYLNQGKSFVGSSLMHAWAEFYIPENGWYGIDVTNNLLVDDNYIRVASGADYTDCSPLKGVLRTNGINTTIYTVEVTQV